MSYPTPIHTWRFDTNNSVSGAGSVYEHNARVLLEVKNALKGTGWSVEASSNTISAGSGDRWAVYTDLVWGPGTHSWLVSTKGNLHICIDLLSSGTGNNGQNCTIIGSLIGFSGGSTSSRPVATDEFTLLASEQPWGGNPSATTQVVHVLSTDVEGTDSRTRVFTCVGGEVRGFWWFDKAKIPIAQYAGNELYAIKAGVIPTFANMCDTTNCNTYYDTAHAVAAYLNLTNPSYDSTDIGRQSSIELNAAFPLADIWAFSTTFGCAGCYGRLDDMWFGSNSAVTGDTANSATLVYFGHVVVPWDGTTPQTGIGGTSTSRSSYYVQDADIYLSAYGKPIYQYFQRCWDSGPGGGHLYWTSKQSPSVTYPYTPPAGGPAIDVCVLAQFTPSAE